MHRLSWLKNSVLGGTGAFLFINALFPLFGCTEINSQFLDATVIKIFVPWKFTSWETKQNWVPKSVSLVGIFYFLFLQHSTRCHNSSSPDCGTCSSLLGYQIVVEPSRLTAISRLFYWVFWPKFCSRLCWHSKCMHHLPTTIL